jgi:hypothetical protein
MVCQLSFQMKMVFHEKKNSSPDSNHHTSAFSRDNHGALAYSRNTLWLYAFFHHIVQNTNNMDSSELSLTKLIFTTSSEISYVNWHFVFLWEWRKWGLLQFDDTTLTPVKALAILQYYSMSSMLKYWKRQMESWYDFENSFGLVALLQKGPQGPLVV